MWDIEWLNPLIGLLQRAQEGWLGLLAWLGLAGTRHGQPAWPWTARLSGENLLIDLGQARRLALTLAMLAAAVLLLLAACVWKKPRWLLVASAPLLLIAAPWPDARVVFVPAYPTSFHRSPTGFSAASIARGSVLYAQHCAACHGDDGRGQGPLAAAQPMWPPDLAGPLLWRRADGDLLWHVLHGMHDRHGAQTMPAFAQLGKDVGDDLGKDLGEDDAWALIDFMKAQGAGQGLRAMGLWQRPVALPDVDVQCEGRAPRRLSSWRGQRLRIVAAGDDSPAAIEDPRLITVVLRSTPPKGAQSGCVAASAEAWEAFALIAGSTRLQGTEFLADRDGWLRALNAPGRAGWSEDDLLCRSEAAPGSARTAPSTDGLGSVIARMDAEPVRFIKGGFVH